MDASDLRIAANPPAMSTRPDIVPSDARAADKAARNFEALLLHQTLEAMFEGISTDGAFGGGFGEEVFRGMMLESVAQSMANSGAGFGIAGPVRAQIAAYADAKKG
ncbi:rod-binding protein [Niveispirillum irakense]|uniref:rod-binding protein n=1 Tax=Niveispirillum irakense TaxID=34011 RepID=UPI0003F64BFC|nr:rod-binding protein [Niveispirillum irakense]